MEGKASERHENGKTASETRTDVPHGTQQRQQVRLQTRGGMCGDLPPVLPGKHAKLQRGKMCRFMQTTVRRYQTEGQGYVLHTIQGHRSRDHRTVLRPGIAGSI